MNQTGQRPDMRSNAPLSIILDAPREHVLERFEDKIIPEPNTGCWLWLGLLDNGGYARFQVKGSSRKASRVAMVLYHDKDPGEQFVLHRCDNPACVNPNHLYLGTSLENARDRQRRGRKGDIAGIKNPNCGSRNHASKLTEDDVRAIRILLRTYGYKRIARKFGITPSSVKAISVGKSWGWLK